MFFKSNLSIYEFIFVQNVKKKDNSNMKTIYCRAAVPPPAGPVLLYRRHVLHPCQLQQVQPSPQPPWRPTFRGDLSQIPAKVGFPLASCLKASPVPGPDWAGQLRDPED